MTIYSIIFFFFATLFAIIFIYSIIKFYLPVYNDEISYVIPLCIMGFFQCIYYLFVNYLFFFEKTKSLMLITFLISIIHLVLTFLFVKNSASILAYIGLFSTFLITFFVVLLSTKNYSLHRQIPNDKLF